MNLRKLAKRTTGLLIEQTAKNLHYRNCIFMLAHMRCGSTALSNIICSHSTVNGYGETHVQYNRRETLGRLALNQKRRKSWSKSVEFQFDKILHSGLYAHAPGAFFEARAIFVLREPEPTIRSICNLYSKLGRGQLRSPEVAADYYIERLTKLSADWDRFPAARRFGMTHQGLMRDPDQALALLSAHFAFDPPLVNRYRSSDASRSGGGGDPLVSGQHDRIEPALLTPAKPIESLGLPTSVASAAEDQFLRLRERFAKEWPEVAI